MEHISQEIAEKQKQLMSLESTYKNQIPTGNSFFFAICEDDVSYYYNLDKYYKKNSKTDDILIRNAKRFPQECIIIIRDIIGEIKRNSDHYLNNESGFNDFLDFFEDPDINIAKFSSINKDVLKEKGFIKKTLKLLSSIKFKKSLLVRRKNRPRGLMVDMVRVNFPNIFQDKNEGESENNSDFILGCYLESWLFVGETMHYHYVTDRNNLPIGAFVFFSDRERYKPKTGFKKDIEQILESFKINVTSEIHVINTEEDKTKRAKAKEYLNNNRGEAKKGKGKTVDEIITRIESFPIGFIDYINNKNRDINDIIKEYERNYKNSS